MFKKMMCSMLSLCVFAMTLPTPALAQSYDSEFDAIEAEGGEFRPLIAYTRYVPAVSTQDEMAYFAATDIVGRLWSIDVNLTKAKATLAADDGTSRIQSLSAEHVGAFRVAANLANTPAERAAIPKNIVAIIGIAIGAGVAIAIYGHQCMSLAAGMAMQSGMNSERCKTDMMNGLAKGQECSISYQERQADLSSCNGGAYTCQVTCS